MYAGTHQREPVSERGLLGGTTAFLRATRIPKTAGAAISQNITPQTSQPQTMSSPMKANSRKFHPSEPNSSPHIGTSRLGALIESAAAEPIMAVISMTGIAMAMRNEPSGHGCELT